MFVATAGMFRETTIMFVVATGMFLETTIMFVVATGMFRETTVMFVVATVMFPGNYHIVRGDYRNVRGGAPRCSKPALWCFGQLP